MGVIKETYRLEIKRFYPMQGIDLITSVESYSFGPPIFKKPACFMHPRPGNNRLVVERIRDIHSAEFASRAKETFYEDEVTEAGNAFSQSHFDHREIPS